MIAFLRAHWKLAAGAGVLAGVFGAGYLVGHRQPAPAVAMRQETAATQTASSTTTTHAAAGPVDRVTDRTWYGDDATPRLALLPGTPGAEKPATVCPPQRVVVRTEHIVEHAGAVVTDTKTQEQHASTESQKLQLTVTPQDSPSRILFLGSQISPERHLVIAGAVRGPDLPFLGPVWAQVQVAPLLSDPLRSQVTLMVGRAF